MSNDATLLIEHPPAYEPERAYALEVVLGTILDVPFVSREGRRRDVAITVLGAPQGCLRMADVLFATPQADWLTDAAMPRRPLESLDVGGDDTLPLLYSSANPGPPLADDEAWLSADVFGSAFFMLTRYEELVCAERDSHGRFPAHASIADQEGFLRRPIVHDYAELLWTELRKLWPRLRRPIRAPGLSISHDVDWPTMPPLPGPTVVRSVGGDLILRRDPQLAVSRLRWELARRRGDVRRDPHDTFDELMDVSEEAGIRSAFYFMAGVTRPGVDGGYSLENPHISAVLRRIHDRGHEIGLHPSYESFRRPEVIASEFTTLRETCARLGIEQSVWGGRQHFLRWQNPTTWQAWDDAGLDYDATLTFADRAGFRTGACIEHPVFNLRTRRQLRLRERPLIVMDGTLFHYEGASHREAEVIIGRLRDQCRRVGGDFTLLWHNSNLLSRKDRALYSRVVLDDQPRAVGARDLPCAILPALGASIAWISALPQV